MGDPAEAEQTSVQKYAMQKLSISDKRWKRHESHERRSAYLQVRSEQKIDILLSWKNLKGRLHTRYIAKTNID